MYRFVFRAIAPAVFTGLLALSVPAQAQTGRFGDLAEGPYDQLVIQNVMVVPGHGGPAIGPYDIVIEQNRIASMTPFNAVTAARRGDTERATGGDEGRRGAGTEWISRLRGNSPRGG